MSTKLRVKIVEYFDGTKKIHAQYRWLLIWRYFKQRMELVNYGGCVSVVRMEFDYPSSAVIFLREKLKEKTRPIVEYIYLSDIQ